MSNKPSGAEFKKKRLEREEKQVKILQQVPKITSFFSRNCQSGKDGTSSLNIQSSNLTETFFKDTESGKVASDLHDKNEKTFSSPDSPDNLNVHSVQATSDEAEQESGPPKEFNSDPALWNMKSLEEVEELRDQVCIKGVIQNISSDFSNSKRLYGNTARYLSVALFVKKLQNGEVQKRTWLAYSPSKGCIYCVPCLLFGQSESTSHSFCTGFNDWKNATQRVLDHENSVNHKDNLGKFKIRRTLKGRVDCQLHVQLEQEANYWRKVLERVVAAVKYLTHQGLALRGKHEHLNTHDSGNFLGLLKFLAEFDPFMAEHLRAFGDKGSGSTSYLSKSTYEELITLMANKVENTILKEQF